jgi:hypothetical protein
MAAMALHYLSPTDGAWPVMAPPVADQQRISCINKNTCNGSGASIEMRALLLHMVRSASVFFAYGNRSSSQQPAKRCPSHHPPQPRKMALPLPQEYVMLLLPRFELSLFTARPMMARPLVRRGVRLEPLTIAMAALSS